MQSTVWGGGGAIVETLGDERHAALCWRRRNRQEAYFDEMVDPECWWHGCCRPRLGWWQFYDLINFPASFSRARGRVSGQMFKSLF